jgi:site-specific recombinase XerD
MSDNQVPALRQRFLDDMRIKGLLPKTQTMYLRAMREFTRFLGHSPDTATPEELRAFQLDMKERGVGTPTFNNRLTVLSFFFTTTCPRPEMKRHMRYQRAAKKIPVVLSAEEVARLLEAAPGPGLRYRAAFSVAYGGGLRASEVTHLKLGDIDSDRMLIRFWNCCVTIIARPGPRVGFFPAATGSIRSRRGSSTARSGWPATLPRSEKRSRPIPCGTALPRIFWRAGPTFG